MKVVDDIVQLLELEKEKIMTSHEIELQQLREQLDYGAVGDMKWLEERLSMSKDKITETILYPFRRELEGKAAYYPEKRGKPWRFNKYAINEWIANNFDRVNW